MRSMSVDAGYMALDEAKEGRTTMILFPNKSWAMISFEMGQPPETVHLRFADEHTSLRSIALDTLILVAGNDADFDHDGMMIAKEKLRVSASPKMIIIHRNEDGKEIPDKVLEGEAVWL